MNLADYRIEVDANNAGHAWFTMWHDGCGRFVIEDYAERLGADLAELQTLAGDHDRTCDRVSGSTAA